MVDVVNKQKVRVQDEGAKINHASRSVGVGTRGPRPKVPKVEPPVAKVAEVTIDPPLSGDASQPLSIRLLIRGFFTKEDVTRWLAVLHADAARGLVELSMAKFLLDAFKTRWAFHVQSANFGPICLESMVQIKAENGSLTKDQAVAVLVDGLTKK